MRRVLTVLFVLSALAAGVLGSGAGDGSAVNPRYLVEMDNAFGLIEGADVKVAGVRAGQIKSFAVDKNSFRALVEIEISQLGFGDLRKDVFCEARPQSLIGEYFLDCLPGTDPQKLDRGARIPVKQTASTVSVDLINNIYRRPYRERLSIFLGELGAALTARGPDLNETIRRANPALRETNKVLRQLAEQRFVIRDLTENADRVVGELAGRRKEISRFIREARDTAQVSGDRQEQVRAQWQRLPTFLRELRPTMRYLGEAADAQRPALQTLSDQAPLLTKFLDELTPFTEASRPSFRTLGEAAKAGKVAVRLARPRIAEVQAFAKDLPELAKNLAITLEHLDNRQFAVEKDPRSPGGQGYTGFEAFLQYVFRQSQATNLYDGNSYLLKVSLFLDNLCAQYTTAEQVKADPENRERCNAGLGPNRPGITSPDPTKTGGTLSRDVARRDRNSDGRDDRTGATVPQATPTAEPVSPVPGVELPADIGDIIERVLPNGLGDLQGLGGEQRPRNPQSEEALLDFLFGA